MVVRKSKGYKRTMLKEISVSNVRAFHSDTWTFPLAPLTIFCGTNSAGKSTVLKTILLLRQSVGKIGEFSNRGGLLRFNGNFVDLGDYEAFVSFNETNRPIRVSFTIEDRFNATYKSLLAEFLSEKTFQHVSDYLKSTKDPQYRLRVEFTFIDSAVIDVAVDDQSLDPSASYTREGTTQAVMQSAKYELSLADAAVLRWDVTARSMTRDKSGRMKRPEYELSMPLKYFEACGGDEIVDTNSVNDKGYLVLDTVLNGMLPIVLEGKKKKYSRSKKETGKKAVSVRGPMPPIIDDVLTDLRIEFDRMHYLGPLRSPGKRYYMLNPDTFSEFDVAGEFLPYILRDRKDDSVTYCAPDNIFKQKQRPLEVALNEWLSFLREEDSGGQKHKEVTSVFQRKVFGEVKVRGAGNKSYALVDTGFGYSQVLPVLLRCLLAPTGGTVIIEQPELHLHPALQIRLAFFFVAVMYSGKQVFVETHSEHIINAIRVAAAENRSQDLAERLKVFYIESGEDKPKVHDLSVMSDGTIPSWPRSFFGESVALAARLLRAQRERR